MTWRRTLAFPAVRAVLLAGLCFGGAVLLYARTAAPSVLSGDSGEFQFAVPLLGIPHPTGYPLYILLGKLATLLPLGDIAYRVTMLSAFAGAGTVALLALLVWRVTRSLLAAVIAAAALTVAPGLWHLSTIAEVYTLNTLLLMLLALTLWHAWGGEWRMENGEWRRDSQPPAPIPSPISYLPSPISHLPSPGWLCAAAFITGLGISHHGSFAFIGAPLLLAFGILPLVKQARLGRHGGRPQQGQPGRHGGRPQRMAFPSDSATGGTRRGGENSKLKTQNSRLSSGMDNLQPSSFILFRLALFGALGLTPWLLVVIQYARLGPFNGLDHGWPQAYFWGAPETWQAALAHVTGGSMRGGVFDLPGPRTLFHIVLTLWERLQFEFGPFGIALGVVGWYRLLRRPLWLWLGSTWILAMTTFYFASLGSAVQDAPVFTLPMLLPWALWIGVGAATLAERVISLAPTRLLRLLQPRLLTSAVLLGLLLLTLAWGQTRLPYGNKANQWLFREFGEGALAQLAPDAVVITRWEQGTILQYLRLIEEQRPDVWIDIVELEDEPWRERAERRYADRPVYIIGSAADAEALGADYIWGTEYAEVFRLKQNVAE